MSRFYAGNGCPKPADNSRGLLFGVAAAASVEAVSCRDTLKVNKRTKISQNHTTPFIASLCYRLALSVITSIKLCSLLISCLPLFCSFKKQVVTITICKSGITQISCPPYPDAI